MNIHLLDFLELNAEMKTQKTFAAIPTAFLIALLFAQITVSNGEYKNEIKSLEIMYLSFNFLVILQF